MTEMYEVDKILRKRLNQKGNTKKDSGKAEYLVKWVGYSEQECTWEPLKNLKFVQDVVDEF